MGKTVESYRMALESEISRWSGFARALRKDDREAFDELMDMCRSYAMAGSNATDPIIFEPMIMSILLFQQKRMRQLERELEAIKPIVANSGVTEEATDAKQLEPKQSNQTAVSGGEQTRFQ